MKNNYKNFIWSILGSVTLSLTFSGNKVCAQEVPVGYKLVWEEEFEGDSVPPNPEIWKHEKGFVRNNELQWYQDSNAWCDGGMLIIEGRRVKRPNPNYDPNSTSWKKKREFIDYTASSIKTGSRKSWKYGYFEIRAKIPAKKGMWPAIWTLGRSGEWPSNGECDIMEYYKGGILANYAWGSAERWKGIWDARFISLDKFEDGWADEFHTWKLFWTEDTMKIFVDDKMLNEVALSRTFNVSNGKNPFRQEHYILLNLAIGGNNGGDPSKTPFPQRYLIDYVKVYQLPEFNLTAIQEQGNGITLNWENPEGVEVIVQRSSNGGEFVDIDTIPDSNTLSYSHLTATNGDYTYRLYYVVEGTKIYTNKANLQIMLPSVKNVALNKEVTADSKLKEDYPAEYAVDGNMKDNESRWVSGETAVPHWLEVDLFDVYEISHLKLYTGWDGYNKAVEDFVLQAWDGTEWKDVYSIEGNKNPEFSAGFAPYQTNKVRLYVTKTPENKVRLYELELFGTFVKANSTVGVAHSKFNIYPNPSDNNIYLSGISSSEVKAVSIYNQQGVKVLETLSTEINISHLASGMYYIKVNGIETRKFIKN